MKKFIRKVNTNIFHAFPATSTCVAALAVEEVRAPLLPNPLWYQHIHKPF